jgi:hypothetical protein
LEKRDRPVEISPEMITAGSEQYLKWQHDNWERSDPNAVANLAARVFVAMEAARRLSL